MQQHTNIAPPMSRRVMRALVVAIGMSLFGCGHAACMFELQRAGQHLDEARELGADERAPYEYYYAQAHYDKARSEAAEADYGDALELAEASTEYAARAVELARAAKGAGQ